MTTQATGYLETLCLFLQGRDIKCLTAYTTPEWWHPAHDSSHAKLTSLPA